MQTQYSVTAQRIDVYGALNWTGHNHVFATGSILFSLHIFKLRVPELKRAT